MDERIIVSGFGGQGVILMGRLLAHSGLSEGRHVTCLPSYGPEMRGGTAHSFVTVSDRRIGSPLFSNPSVLIAMNRPSLDRFESSVEPGGCILVNSFMIDREVDRDDLAIADIAATAIAAEMGDVRVANMVALGAFISVRPIIDLESLISSMRKILKRHEMASLNEQAIRKGASSVRVRR